MRTSLVPIVAMTSVVLLPVILCQYQTPDQYGQYGSRYPGYGQQGQYGSQYGSQYQTGQQFPTSYQSGGYVPRGSGAYNPSDPYNTNCKFREERSPRRRDFALSLKQKRDYHSLSHMQTRIRPDFLFFFLSLCLSRLPHLVLLRHDSLRSRGVCDA